MDTRKGGVNSTAVHLQCDRVENNVKLTLSPELDQRNVLYEDIIRFSTPDAARLFTNMMQGFVRPEGFILVSVGTTVAHERLVHER